MFKIEKVTYDKGRVLIQDPCLQSGLPGTLDDPQKASICVLRETVIFTETERNASQ